MLLTHTAVSCAKKTELIEMQFGMLTWVSPGSCIGLLNGNVDAPREGGTFKGI